MAKLDGIKVVNENTVEYNGFVYELVTGDAKAADVIKASVQELDVTEGAFYLVTEIDDDNDIVFKDDVNDSNYFMQGEHSVFRKSHAITNDKLTDAEGVVKIELPDGTKLEGTPSDLEKITRSMQKMLTEQVATVEMPEEVAEGVLEAKQALLKEGDFARVVGVEHTEEACGPHNFETGTIINLYSFDADDNTFETRYLNGDIPDAEWVHRKDLEPLTKEEVEHITHEAEEEKKAKAEREKWAVIGREVGEIKKGDIVRTTSHCRSVNPVGTIGVAREDGTVDSCSTVALAGESGNWSRVELIVPVEQRFDTVG
ncbi:hypothetical protein [Bacillus cereus]|uniref:hypothetical protein n=1 Tax=Bacillus cereus TaxID=1396 RepID=UPI000BEBB44B|nr:hypothetical protein [Bacillus cereus]PEE49752.1 hypothetical protein COM80_28955 [Bacillus cereus]PFV63320.1 hypothetical protein COL16_28800 [Bacillus cereus]PGY64375.1 hypothetical protein COE34_28405 [Bacillus cereus]